eukprot:2456326-Rhodomonas_salina.5
MAHSAGGERLCERSQPRAVQSGAGGGPVGRSPRGARGPSAAIAPSPACAPLSKACRRARERQESEGEQPRLCRWVAVAARRKLVPGQQPGEATT